MLVWFYIFSTQVGEKEKGAQYIHSIASHQQILSYYGYYIQWFLL